MAVYCTIADLTKARPVEWIAGLADDVNIPPDIASAAAVEVMNRAIADASNKVLTYLIGRVDLTDSQVLEDCRRWTVALCFRNLESRRMQYTQATIDEAKEAVAELKAIQAGRQQTGATPQVSNEAWSSTQDTSPVYNPAAYGGSGTDSGLLEGF